ncbi:sigma-70 family RNA polymerase sigma factor [Chitinophaga horti]|uniref:Sigma-70 family RNA polymerase sigma factor n=1 Tax=Chitinophaga horti TaxID=2920382 RepID=A0ABY6IV53_9BACT|nr:sigma-70 family RNA polymerase sigma factor [Chitinophaga horti]UYQ91245.1 sigma-70 family RNA polymerase sigma factor [Chitinophaga horti]
MINNYQQELFPYAYNILGSAEDARDAIQDVLGHYVAVDRSHIENEKGYLVKAVINQSINLKAKRRVLSTEEVWLPEPIATEQADSSLHTRDIVSYSMLVLLEQLNPRERAVFILKEAFSYSHEDIAEVLGFTVENSRKLLSRAKARLEKSRQPAALPRQDEGFRMIEQYIGAIQSGDVARLEKLLSADIAFYADGGPGMQLVMRHCQGADKVAGLLQYVYKTFQQNYTIHLAVVNHQPAILYYDNSRLTACQVLEIQGGVITQVLSMLDPEKLKLVAGK